MKKNQIEWGPIKTLSSESNDSVTVLSRKQDSTFKYNFFSIKNFTTEGEKNEKLFAVNPLTSVGFGAFGKVKAGLDEH